jgi:hypothetical protein
MGGSVNWLTKVFQRLTPWHSNQETFDVVTTAPVRMVDLLKEAHLRFQANKIGEAESLLLKALREPDADTLSYLTDHAVRYL